MFKNNLIVSGLLIAAISLGVTGCSSREDTAVVSSTTSNTVTSSQVDLDNDFNDWTEASHSKKAEPGYDTVFPQDGVNRLDIVITEENWEAMTDNMNTLYGGSNERGARGGGPGVAAESASENPIFVESQVFFENKQWYNVGLRFKGNSSLKSVWSSGNLKLPFKMDFDEFEDDYPELKNQRFYGFKQLSFSSGFEDDSLIHEKIATEAFKTAGIASPETAFYQLYVDYGEGPTYFGLYTAVEVIGDTLLENNFSNDDGNIYKAEGAATSFSTASASTLKTGFVKKSNEDEDDWGDLEALSNLLHSDTRISDYEVWKKDLETLFDTSAFLNWLAVNTVIQNWDTYGNMTHNYYLYNNPNTNQLTWLPWDNNESFSEGKQSPLSLTFNGVGEDWPLIRYMMDDADYQAQYVGYVKDFTEKTLDTDSFKERVSFLHNLISPYVVGNNGEQDGFTFLKNEAQFTSSLKTLLDFIEARIAVASALSLESDWDYDATLESNQRGPGGSGFERGGAGGGRGDRVPPNVDLPYNWDSMNEDERFEFMQQNRPEF